MKTTLLILSALVALCFAGCEIFSSSACITISLPELPRHWAKRFAGLFFTIEFPGENGKIESVKCEPGVSMATIMIRKKINTPVLGIPHAACGLDLYPCGSVFAGCNPSFGAGEEGNLALTWENGFVAEILLCLIERGFSTEAINVSKLSFEIEKKSQGDPWTLDRTQIIEQLGSLDFSVYHIDPLPSANVTISEVNGDWFSDDPFTRIVYSGPDQTLCIESLRFGFHRFFNTGTSELIDIVADEKEPRWIRYARDY